MTKKFNYRNSDNGQYTTERKAEQRPKEHEREAVKPTKK